MENAEKPLLTLAICCYKFERFIEEALDGAFAQTYRPLEIVISDDHSPDRSWERILAKVASHGYQVPAVDSVGAYRVYPDRPFEKIETTTVDLSPLPLTSPTPLPLTSPTVILNRNPANIGLALHENRLFELSQGEWIAFQAGDDVSVPERMEKIEEAIAKDPDIRCLHSAVKLIDSDGKQFVVGEGFRKASRGRGSTLPAILGAGAVYHRDVYGKFGPLWKEVHNEDHVLPLRAVLLGKIKFIEHPLVDYRKHESNQSGAFKITAEGVAKYRRGMASSYMQSLCDLQYAMNHELKPWREIDHYRGLVQDEFDIHTFFSDWYFRKGMRMHLLQSLFCSPSKLFLFLQRIVGRLFNRLVIK